MTPNVLFSRAGRGTNREAPPLGHGVGWNNLLYAVLADKLPRLFFFLVSFDFWVPATKLRYSVFRNSGVGRNCGGTSKGEVSTYL